MHRSTTEDGQGDGSRLVSPMLSIGKSRRGDREIKRLRKRGLWSLAVIVLGTSLVMVFSARCASSTHEVALDEGPVATPDPSATPSGPVGEGTISVSPTTVLADSFETLRFEFTVGASGMEMGGGVRLEFPTKGGFASSLLWDNCQVGSPDEPGHVEARVSSPDGARINIRCSRTGNLDLIVRGAAVSPGARIHFTYTGNVQALARILTVRVQSRRNESDPWRQIAALPGIRILPTEAALLLVVAPADVEQGAEFDLAVVALDRFGNRATGYRGRVSFTSTDPEGSSLAPYTFVEEDAGVHVFSGAQYRTPGFQRVTVTDGVLIGESNHSQVVAKSSLGYRRYFGDTHFHTGTGTGNVGRVKGLEGFLGDHGGDYTTEEDAYAYARDVMRLDFASVSEHDGEAFTDALWIKSQDITESFYQPRVFTTFFAHEWTSRERGHRLVMYRDYGNEIYRYVEEEYDTPMKLWAALEEQGAPFISVPHVMGEWTESEVHPLWVDVNNEHQSIGEIYSNHNLTDGGGLLRDDPQRFELDMDDSWSYQYAWHVGHRIGLIGSSDNHLGTPGANDSTTYVGPTGGLAIALAERNDRGAIWDAFEKRRTYATTGTRILLDFRIDGHLMGDEFTSATNPTIAVAVAGTAALERVELVKHCGSGYEVIYLDEPDSEVSSFAYVDEDFRESSFYYVRVTQVDGEMAWSSPIWIDWGS